MKTQMMLATACVAGAVGGLAGAYFGSAGLAHAQNAGTVRTQRLEIVDSAGNLRGVWTIGSEGLPVMAFTDARRKVRITLAVTKSGAPSIVLTDAKDVNVLAMAVSDDSSAAINFAKGKDARGDDNIRGSVVIEADGRFEVQTRDAQGRNVAWPR